MPVSEMIEALPPTHELLVTGGDVRIRLENGKNKYGCKPYPDPEMAQFGSSTASTISVRAFQAADDLREKIINGAACDAEFERIGHEFFTLCGISDIRGVTLHFCSSGTDAHQVASRLITPGNILVVSREETGGGVPAALSGGKVHQVSVRNRDGAPRSSDDIDAQAIDMVESFAKKRGKVLLVLVDVSKTGMVAPTPACARRLKARFPDHVEVLVDASQFRIGRLTLRAYLEAGFWVAVTGSKFLTGPAFSGALLIPESSGRILPADQGGGNIGLLLRWEAALAELRAFAAVSEAAVENFLSHFADIVQKRLAEDARLEPLPVPRLIRLHPGWDTVQTIFPFRLKTQDGGFLCLEEAKRIHALLSEDMSRGSAHDIASFRCNLGQPVACSALRLCSSSRLVVDSVENGNTVVQQAFLALDKAVWLMDHP